MRLLPWATNKSLRKTMKHLAFLIPVLFLIGCGTSPEPYVKLEGELQQWHKLTLLISGPETAEFAYENPFLDYKLDVNFSSVKAFCEPTRADTSLRRAELDQSNVP